MRAAPVFDPHRLDMLAFARAAGRLAGQWPLRALPRLRQDLLPGAEEQVVDWSAEAALEPVQGGEDRVLLRLHARVTLPLRCQRCLQPVAIPLDVRRTLRFVRGEREAEALDEHSEEDVLALGQPLDLQALIEDELILALPLVPRHETCPQPLPMSAGEEELASAVAAERPFEALAALRAGKAGKAG